MLKIYLAFLGLCFTIAVQGQKLPSSKKILHTMTQANDWFMKAWPDPGKDIVVDRTRPSNIWTRGVYYEGLMALYDIRRDSSYYHYALDWARKHKWGLRNGITTRNADDQCCGQTYLDLYALDPDPRKIKDIKACIDNTMKSDKADDWSWIDAIQMAMPVFTRLGLLYKDTSYFSRMYEMYSFTRNKHGEKGLYNAGEGLWWRDKDFDPPYKEPNGKNCYWSRGNGWVFAALVRVLNELPPSDPHYSEYLNDFKSMAEALKACQRSDGFWNVSLHDETHFGGPEVTGTSLFVYGFAWGLKHGVLKGSGYKKAVKRGYAAMASCVHEDGFLGWVQGTGKEPADGQPLAFDKHPNFDDFGLGCFLLGASAVYQLKN